MRLQWSPCLASFLSLLAWTHLVPCPRCTSPVFDQWSSCCRGNLCEIRCTLTLLGPTSLLSSDEQACGTTISQQNAWRGLGTEVFVSTIAAIPSCMRCFSGS